MGASRASSPRSAIFCKTVKIQNREAKSDKIHAQHKSGELPKCWIAFR